jgi:peptide chain release factor 2
LRNYRNASGNSEAGFDVETKKNRIKELDFLMQDPDMWAAEKRTEVEPVLKEYAELKDTVKTYEDLQDTLELISSSEEQQETELFKAQKEIVRLEVQRLFTGQHDRLNAVITIFPGAGGEDAADWAQMLFRMYKAYAEKKGWKIETVDAENDVFSVEGPYAFGYLKLENGVHRLVRVSPFSSQQLRHTSFALVEVLPEFKETSLQIRDEDLKVEFFRSSGPGGQNVNKVETAVRIVHTPTGIVTSSQVERSQSQNRERAMRILEAKLVQLMQEQRVEEIGKLRPKAKPEWGNQIRSYVLNPYKLVKDHRTDYETTQVDKVLEEGELDGFIESELTRIQ